jgi:hypothetical protein
MCRLKTKYFFTPKYLALIGFLFACEMLMAHEARKIYQPRRAIPKYTFSEPKEVFDSSWYQAERYSVYQYLYSFFEKNPINFKSLNQGHLSLHFSYDGNGMYKFDSILNPSTAQTTKVFKLFGKKFSSPIITDSNTLTIEIFIRKSKKISKSLDTFDLLSTKNSFVNKTLFNVYEKGIYTNSSNVLKSIIEPHQIKTYKSVYGEELVFVKVFERASFISGMHGFFDFLDNHIVIPQQLKEEEFSCRMKIYFEVNIDGKIENVTVERKLPSDTYSENLYKQMENELIRIFKRQVKWRPKKINGIPYKSMLSLNFRLDFES